MKKHSTKKPQVSAAVKKAAAWAKKSGSAEPLRTTKTEQRPELACLLCPDLAEYAQFGPPPLEWFTTKLRADAKFSPERSMRSGKFTFVVPDLGQPSDRRVITPEVYSGTPLTHLVLFSYSPSPLCRACVHLVLLLLLVSRL